MNNEAQAPTCLLATCHTCFLLWEFLHHYNHTRTIQSFITFYWMVLHAISPKGLSDWTKGCCCRVPFQNCDPCSLLLMHSHVCTTSSSPHRLRIRLLRLVTLYMMRYSSPYITGFEVRWSAKAQYQGRVVQPSQPVSRCGLWSQNSTKWQVLISNKYSIRNVLINETHLKICHQNIFSSRLLQISVKGIYLVMQSTKCCTQLFA